MGVDDWRITMLLADAAQVTDGKLSLLGGGWQFIGSPQSPYAVAIVLAVPWNETNRRHKITVVLQDSDGKPVMVASDPLGEDAKVMAFSAEFEVGRPPGYRPGTSVNVPLAFGVGTLNMVPGRYEWVCTLNDEATKDDWRLPFDVKP
jgi:hypothetical protein